VDEPKQPKLPDANKQPAVRRPRMRESSFIKRQRIDPTRGLRRNKKMRALTGISPYPTYRAIGYARCFQLAAGADMSHLVDSG